MHGYAGSNSESGPEQQPGNNHGDDAIYANHYSHPAMQRSVCGGVREEHGQRKSATHEAGAVRDRRDLARISHEQIAEAVGASRPAVTRALSKMEREGLVKTRRLSVQLCNLFALVAVAAV